MTNETISTCELFVGLPDAELDKIVAAGETIDAKPGIVLLREKEDCSEIFVVLDGEVEVFLPKTEKRLSRVVLARLGAGSVIGEFSFVDDEPASATAVTIEPSRLFRISHSALLSLLQQGDAGTVEKIYRNLLRTLVKKLRAGTQDLDLVLFA